MVSFNGVSGATQAQVQKKTTSGGNQEVLMKASLNDFSDAADKIKDKSDQFTKGVDNIKGAITSTAGAIGGIAVSVKGATEILKPTTDSIKEGLKKPGVQNLWEKAKGLARKAVNAAKNNPKAALIALGITAAAVAAAVIGRTIVKTRAEQAAQKESQPQQPETAKTEGQKLDVVSEA